MKGIVYHDFDLDINWRVGQDQLKISFKYQRQNFLNTLIN